MTPSPVITQTPPSPHKLVFGAAVGRPEDFYVLGYCKEVDEEEFAVNPAHEEFTWIFRFVADQRTLVTRVSQRIDDLWLAPSGTVLAVGAPRGVLHITGASCSEESISTVPGTFAGIWGAGEGHVFACGHHESFLLYRKSGAWLRIQLPLDINGLWSVCGTSDRDVYAVSDLGEILHFDGQHLSALDSPTTRWLTSMALMPGARMCIGGYAGTLLYGNVNGWRFVDTGTDQPLLKLISYRSGVCFTTPEGIWWFDGASLPLLLVPQRARWINAIGDSIMIVDGDDAWLYDGATLTKLDTTL